MVDSQQFNTSDFWLENLDALIAEHIESEAFSNAFLADRMKISETHFYRLVKEKTGKTPNKYIRKWRLRLAKEMIESDPRIDRVSLVAYKVGFQRVDYFSRLYEAEFGVRPAESIRRIKQG